MDEEDAKEEYKEQDITAHYLYPDAESLIWHALISFQGREEPEDTKLLAELIEEFEL
jgi:hypothetical protein